MFHKSFVLITQSDSGTNIKPRRSLSDPAVLAHRAREAQKESGKKKKKKKKKGEAKSNPRVMDDKKDLVRYFLGCRRAMADTNILAIADDESRVGGKERLMLCAMSEQGIACWAPPQAGRIIPCVRYSMSIAG